MDSARPRNSTRRRRAVPDIYAIPVRFGRAQALIRVAHRSLEDDDRTAARPEAIALEAGLAVLDAIYNELDVADQQQSRAYKHQIRRP